MTQEEWERHYYWHKEHGWPYGITWAHLCCFCTHSGNCCALGNCEAHFELLSYEQALERVNTASYVRTRWENEVRAMKKVLLGEDWL